MRSSGAGPVFFGENKPFSEYCHRCNSATALLLKGGVLNYALRKLATPAPPALPRYPRAVVTVVVVYVYVPWCLNIARGRLQGGCGMMMVQN